MRAWKLTGLVATIIITLSFPLYLFKVSNFPDHAGSDRLKDDNTFMGSLKCAECHDKEYETWKGSHHDNAMDVASDKTVLGDFNNAMFNNNGVITRFYKKGARFFVHTQGDEGKMKEYEITHTFGFFPLQQYLIPFNGGRLQCLPIAWDAREKRWYDLNQGTKINPDDWLYWTKAGQNWNGMCAECHSTNLKKNFNIKSNTYNTTWTDIDVGCESCHGPGFSHVIWAETPDMGRADVYNYNLKVKTSDISSKELVNQCAPCHSRRAILGDYTHSEPDLLDVMLPSLLTPELYYNDGQILEEVYEYGSFTQSKMYHRDVKCSDCHDVHSIKPIKKGNELCLTCHRAKEYDTFNHHFHKKKGENGDPIKSHDGSILFDVGTGSECTNCHMPGKNYMVIDYRLDHSLRVPRPDLSEKTGAPNACNRCHTDKTNRWSDDWITKWYGPGRKGHYGEIIDAARKQSPGSYEEVKRLALDPLYPVIVRATALSILSSYPQAETVRAYEISLMDMEPMIRRTAIECLNNLSDEEKARLIAPLIYDPVKAVRIQAASALAGGPSGLLDIDQKKVYMKVLYEFITSMEYSGDFSFGRFNLGNLYKAIKDDKKAIENYEAAIAIDKLFYPAKVNLAMLYNEQGDKAKAEEIFRETLKDNHNLPEIAYSLALLLAEKEEYNEAAIFMGKAAENMPLAARVHYNYGLLLQYLERDKESELALKKAIEIEPGNMDFLYALFDFYFKRSEFNKAKEVTEQMMKYEPGSPAIKEMVDMVTTKILQE
jgi:tetratricopeptide (TPR) repeat protein